MSPAEKKRKAARQTVRQSKHPSATRQPARQPAVIKTSEHSITGIHPFDTSRYAIGYVLGGYKRLYTGDICDEAGPGDIFFLSKGIHYVENVPDGRRPFEQIMFLYTPEQIGRIIADLSVVHHADTGARHSCDGCRGKGHVVEQGWTTLKYFFSSANRYLQEGFFMQHPASENLALTSLIFHIISRPEGCLRSRVLGSTDPEKELMERQIRDYIFSGITLEEFARKNNRSLTSFKKKFKSYFNESPHRWVVRQRLMHARLGLISTGKPVSHIGAECRFPNTSHFIKLFRREFGITPAQYRRKYAAEVIEA